MPSGAPPSDASPRLTATCRSGRSPGRTSATSRTTSVPSGSERRADRGRHGQEGPRRHQRRARLGGRERLLRRQPGSGDQGSRPEANREKRLPYETEDLKAIFRSLVYSSGARPAAGAGEAAYWLPLLALFTGARLEELGQLLVTDVKRESGVCYLDINTLDEGKSLKTRSSRRRVPLHAELIRLGFLKYVSKLPPQGSLWPDPKPDNKGKLTGNWSKWWGRYARQEAGITDPRKVFHSFRHTFKDATRAAGIDEALSDALTGHSGGGVRRTYGRGYPIEKLAEAIGLYATL